LFTLDRSIKLALSTGRTCEASRVMGEKLAKLSLKKNIKKLFLIVVLIYIMDVSKHLPMVQELAVYNFK
jgi:hypothetical protein